MALVHELQPKLVLDLHAPIELILVREGVPREPVEMLAESAGLRVVSELEVGSPGAFDEWLLEQGIPAIVTRSSTRACRSSACATCPGSRRCSAGSASDSRKALNDGFRSPGRRDQPGLPALRIGLVLEQEPEQHVDPRMRAGDRERLADVRGLRRP